MPLFARHQISELLLEAGCSVCEENPSWACRKTLPLCPLSNLCFKKYNNLNHRGRGGHRGEVGKDISRHSLRVFVEHTIVQVQSSRRVTKDRGIFAFPIKTV